MSELSRELNSRTSDGMTVILWWEQDNDRTYVTVDDLRTNEHYQVDVPTPELANEVFMHPSVYKVGELALTDNVQLGDN